MWVKVKSIIKIANEKSGNYLESKVAKYLLELGYTEHDCIPKSYTYQQLVITIFTEITVICATWCKHSML